MPDIDAWMQEAWERLRAEQGLPPEARALVVSIPRQELALLEGGTVLARYPVSTSRFGAGCEQDSGRTPTGAHRVAARIGEGAEPGAVFKGRAPTGEVVQPQAGSAADAPDVITSRILWLEGLEAGHNCGAGVDTHERYIYIHGTANEGLIGQPASQGCVRMRNSDVIALFNEVPAGTLVYLTGEA
jgi:lipoprotein-anchoring transpeptidase ErfK/SrfK